MVVAIAPDVFLKKLAEFAMKMKSANGGSIEIKCGSSGEVVDVRREEKEKSETQQHVKAEIVH